MTEHERIDQLERKIAEIEAKQTANTTWLSQVTSRLVFLEARQQRLMKELGITPDDLENPSVAQADAQELLRAIPIYRLN